MAAKLTCPSCSAANPKRISEIVQEQSVSGAKIELADQYKPPKQSWGFVQGFFLAVPVNVGIVLSLTTPGEATSSNGMADWLSTVAFLIVWGGYGTWKNKAYKEKLDQWKKTIALKFSCQGCKHVFDA
jgi:hypothetical protein